MSARTHWASCTLLALALACGCTKRQQAETGSDTTGPARVLASPASPGSTEPELIAGGGRLFLSWVQQDSRGRAFRYSVLESGAWSAPRTIVEGDPLLANEADCPGLAPLADGSLVAHWLWQHDASKGAYDVRAAWSMDGTSWSAPRIPHQDGTATEHGFVSSVPDPLGGATMVWLDGREFAGHEAESSAGNTRLMAADFVRGRFGPEQVLDPRVCDCCQTAAVRTTHGVLVAYRDRDQDEVRDIVLMRREAGTWTSPYPLARDGWKLPGCPVNGPALAARGDAVAAAWFTMAGDTAKVSVALSNDGGATFSRPVRVDEGKALGRVDVAWLPNGDALVVWLENTEKGSTVLRARRVRHDLQCEAAFGVAPAMKRASGFPRLACRGDSAYFAWTQDSEPPQVHVATVPVAPVVP
jgi:hypothetical protein